MTDGSARALTNAYVRELNREHATGSATEHSYRPALKTFLETLGGQGVVAVNDPKRVAAGAPDFVIQRQGLPVGFVECKDVGKDLDAEAESDQLTRYRTGLDNLILTDYLEFRWYVNGVLQMQGEICKQLPAPRRLSSSRVDEVTNILSRFLRHVSQAIVSPDLLAERLANKAALLRDSMKDLPDFPVEVGIEADEEAEEAVDEISPLTPLQEHYKSYRAVLLPNLSPDEYADLQAQTVAYGLFAARCLDPDAPSFSRTTAVFADTTPFLKQVFNLVAGPEADERLLWVIDDIADMLACADIRQIRTDLGVRDDILDPIIHFYEDFLAAYDPDLRELRGVYYTPKPVVSYIVRSVDRLLRDRFGLSDGLADRATIENGDSPDETEPKVTILDPAVGTGTFLRETISHIRNDLRAQGMGGAWSRYVEDHLLPRLHGFELLIAPYVICHLNLSMELGGPNGQFQTSNDQRLNVFLTNTLEKTATTGQQTAFASVIVQEARQADAVKQSRPVMVIIGNPPYSGESANQGDWIVNLLRGKEDKSSGNYFSVDGEPLGERNTKWLLDDYVKFIRFGQWRIEKTGEGILSFVTNHRYLDASLFRGMRRSLMTTFDEIRVLDLHGSVIRGDISLDGSPDENVFDIRQGVAIVFLVKYPESREEECTVYHADLYGPRSSRSPKGKYEWLLDNDISSTPWQEIEPSAPQYLFVPFDSALVQEYEQGWSLPEIFRVKSTSIVTANDKIAIQFSAAEMRDVGEKIRDDEVEFLESEFETLDASKQWDVGDARDDLEQHDDVSKNVRPILYRVFDQRYTIFTGRSGGFVHRPRSKVMQNLTDKDSGNLALISCRQQSQRTEWNHVWVSRTIVESCAISNKTSEINYTFPLYIVSNAHESQMDNSAQGQMQMAADNRVANIDSDYAEALSAALNLDYLPVGNGDMSDTFGPEDILGYIYAVLHTSNYRGRYADLLARDHPRIPSPHNLELFTAMSALGRELIAAHLMEHETGTLPSFDADGDDEVAFVQYIPPNNRAPGRVKINDSQYFDDVTPQVWKHLIGVYQPAEKWLAERVGRTLSVEDIEHYRKICGAIAQSQNIVEKIDGLDAD
ncbi:type ISP restriction/modification enzyme [Candidatus Poriferisodalis sp.]|uniref:type ISP restriction/modification enzyme n=1 Tax=Candidatus Poriferisodalis sp. TaxID=3101277 RepID=UPI003B5ABC11